MYRNAIWTWTCSSSICNGSGLNSKLKLASTEFEMTMEINTKYSEEYIDIHKDIPLYYTIENVMFSFGNLFCSWYI